MGNVLDKEYTVGPVVASGGPGCIWRIYAAKKKDGGESVSLWVIDKDKIEKDKNISKNLREQMYGVLRKNVCFKKEKKNLSLNLLITFKKIQLKFQLENQIQINSTGHATT